MKTFKVLLISLLALVMFSCEEDYSHTKVSPPKWLLGEWYVPNDLYENTPVFIIGKDYILFNNYTVDDNGVSKWYPTRDLLKNSIVYGEVYGVFDYIINTNSGDYHFDNLYGDGTILRVNSSGVYIKRTIYE